MGQIRAERNRQGQQILKITFMMQNIYYTIAIIVYSLFLIQFIISLFSFDRNSDFTVSDSFKGLIHFLMGYVGYISIVQNYSWESQIVAVIIGIIFMFILRKFILKLHDSSILEQSELIGIQGLVYLKSKDYYWVSIYINEHTTQIKCLSDNSYNVGDVVLIKQFINGNYYI